jgi:AAA15 family ATPase/GTPase
MIKSVKISNFKSVVDLTMELGSFNVLIGENGCGKSNILEAIAFGAAASADKLDNEFLGSRGIRVTNPDFMFSAFSVLKTNNPMCSAIHPITMAGIANTTHSTSDCDKWGNSEPTS